MEKGWKKVYSTTQAFQADLIKTRLLAEGIEAVVLNKKDSSYVAIGYVEVYVHQDNLLKAINIIEPKDDGDTEKEE